MPNIPYPVGAELAVRLTHLFEMKDGKIVREIAYEMSLEEGGRMPSTSYRQAPRRSNSPLLALPHEAKMMLEIPSGL